MRKYKGWILLVVCILAGVLMTGCGKDNSDKQNSETSQNTESEQENSKTAESSEQQNVGNSKDGKVLVVYYSATGNTKTVAEKIAELTNGEIFELKPENEYTEKDLDYNDSESRVSKEHDDEKLREVELTEVTPDDFESAKVVILGYPLWWQIAAWPVNQFVENNDFTGKTVIPFCTSASSDIGDSGKLLEKMAGTDDWQDGMRFSSNASEREIRDWVKEINLN